MKQLKTGIKKPWSGKCIDPPYYDKYDLHVHIWKKGYRIGKLASVEDPHAEKYSEVKVRNFNMIYCSVCHCIKPNQPYVPPDEDIAVTALMKKMKISSSHLPVTYKYNWPPRSTLKKFKSKRITKKVSWLLPFEKLDKDYITLRSKK